MDTSEGGQEKIVDSNKTNEELAVNGNIKSQSEAEMVKDIKVEKMSVDSSNEQLNDNNKDTSDEINLQNESNKDNGEDLKMDIAVPEGSAQNNNEVTDDSSNVVAEKPNETKPSSINNEQVNDVQAKVQSEEPAPTSTEDVVTKMEVDTDENVDASKDDNVTLTSASTNDLVTEKSALTDDNAIVTSQDEIKSFKVEEGEEEFKGFHAVTEELQNQEVVKTLQIKEENELQEMEVFVSKVPDIMLSPSAKRRKKEVEESDLSSHCSSPALSVASQLSVLSFTKRSRTGSPASRGSRKSTIDLSNPKYLVPFEFGWKREVVTRAITSREDGISKDVYYFHPSGKKLRSLREVSEKMTPGLTIENFTFYKEPLGADPQFETIRNARTRGFSPLELTAPRPFTSPRARLEKPSAGPTPVKETPPANSSPAKESPKPMPLRNFVKTPKEPAPKPPPPAKREKLVLKFNKGTPKIALKKSPAAVNGERKSPRLIVPKLEGPKPHPSAPSGPKRKITPRKKPVKPQNNNKEDGKGSGKGEGGEMEMGMIPPLWSPTAGSNKSSSNESLSWSHLDEEKSVSEEGRMRPCTIRCTKAMGLIPTLQCSVCLCLYHPECCDMASAPSYRQLHKYVCKNCKTKANETKSKNLVKHITPAVVTDKNPPIVSPKPIHPGLASSPTTATASGTVRMPQVIRPKLPSGKPGIGGTSSPSTWLPPANSLFRSPTLLKNFPGKVDDSTPPPQALVNMNNKRYIVVPKNNVLSVATNQSLSPTKAETVQTTTIITPTPTSTIIQGPPLHSNPFIQPAANASGVVLVPFGPGDSTPLEPATPQHIVVNPLPGSSATAVSSQPDLPIGSETTDQMPKEIESTSKSPSGDGGNNESMQKFMRNICIGYSALLNVFQYLKVQELLRAGRVCRLWRDLASHSSLWRTVRMKNSQVTDWKGFTDSLLRHDTKHLDLRKMLMSVDDAEEMWSTFAKYISTVKCLERLDMCRCSVQVITRIMEACPHLSIFSAQMIGVRDQAQNQNQKLSLESVAKMTNLKELRLKSFFGLHLTGSLKSLTELKGTLTTLSLTSVKNLSSCELNYLGQLENLVALELGECSELPETFPTEVIAKLTTLKRIRLEKGPWNTFTNDMIYQMSKLKNLVQLELINFDVRPGFDKALASCTNIKRLLLIPTYVTQSATTNNIILSGAFKLYKTLTHFVWVVTMELLKVTELFVDQCEGKGSKKSGGNSVPVLKPVPQPSVKVTPKTPEAAPEESGTEAQNTTPITVIPIDELFQMLQDALPTTKVKLLKIPFQNTWRQTITESDKI